jgi:putative phosphoribosyl transferase
MRFYDRHDAGRQLASRLEHLAGTRPVVLGLPRGGIVVAEPVARRLHAPLEPLLVRKIGAPNHPEYAIGAVAMIDEPVIVVNESTRPANVPHPEAFQHLADIEMAHLRRQQELFRGPGNRTPLRDCCAIIVDDGVATGSTVRAAIGALRQRPIARLVLAVPVGPPRTIDQLRDLVDELHVLNTPPRFFAVGEFYDHFEPTHDDTVIRILAQHGGPVSPKSSLDESTSA